MNTAIDYWNSSLIAARTLCENFEANNTENNTIILTNTIIVTLVTGFEQYCKTRFMEIENILGKNPDVKSIIKEFWKSRFEDKDFLELLRKRAIQNKTTPVQQLIKDSNFSFQDYHQCKKLYLRGYNIDIDNLQEILEDDIDFIKKCIRYRNRIIHVNPMLSPLNEIEIKLERGMGKEEPVVQSKKFSEKAIVAFDSFICRLDFETCNGN